MEIVYRWEAAVRMILVLMMGCVGGAVEDDDDGGGLVLGGDDEPDMADCAAWLAESERAATTPPGFPPTGTDSG
jgi:hypothetical protein